jgi:hypothetical protein
MYIFPFPLLFIFHLCSLENAGENSVVSILRCVRSVLGLLQFNMSSGNLSSLGINYEVLFKALILMVFKALKRFKAMGGASTPRRPKADAFKTMLILYSYDQSKIVLHNILSKLQNFDYLAAQVFKITMSYF